MHYLSIISPFYNSEKKCHRLLSTLSKIKDKGIEIILVDDGSTDNTISLLQQFKQSSYIDVLVIAQENKGPGGARNTGLKAAKGDYVWFVDSDDNIMPDAIEVVFLNKDRGYDFIDFDYVFHGQPTNSMKVAPGIYNVNDSIEILEKSGRLCTKVFNKEFLIKNQITYPEYCIYEDNMLGFFYPLFIKNFLKVDATGYIHYADFESITRRKPSLKDLDRLYTAYYGFLEATTLTSDKKHLAVLKNRFTEYYLINSIFMFASKKPSESWIVSYAIMKQYRKHAKKFDINLSLIKLLNFKKFKNRKFKYYFILQWYLSYLIILDSAKFIEKSRMKSWGVPFEYNRRQVNFL